MSDFERKIPPCRLAEVHHGDTMQRIAAREMGDANRWPELVWINGLTHPYLTGDPARATASVLLYGSMIRVPAPVGYTASGSNSNAVYGADCRLDGGQLAIDGAGDLSVVAGVDNLRQQLTHRVTTPRGQMARHPTYGCLSYRLIGKVAGPTSGKLAGEYVKAALGADYRVSHVTSVTASVVGDTIRTTARAIAIEGSSIDVIIP